MKIEIHKNVDGDRFWFRFVAKNNQVLATSEMYTAKHNAIGGALAIVNGFCDFFGGDPRIGDQLIVDLT